MYETTTHSTISRQHSNLFLTNFNVKMLYIKIYYIYVCMHACMYVCMHACMHACIHIHAYTHVYVWHTHAGMYTSRKSGHPHLKSTVGVLSIGVLSTFTISACGFVCWGFVC